MKDHAYLNTLPVLMFMMIVSLGRKNVHAGQPTFTFSKPLQR